MAKVTLHATIFGEDGIKTRDYETALIPDAKNQEMRTRRIRKLRDLAPHSPSPQAMHCPA